MYESLGNLQLKDGTSVEAGVVAAPDHDWAEPIETFLAHQDPIWNWQNHRVLSAPVGAEIYFYVLHQDGRLISNMISVESGGVGLRGHVWTPPHKRRNGACSQLQKLQMEHFRQRGGRFLALYTDYNSVAFHIYRRFGFTPIEDRGGHMCYLSLPSRQFEADYFAKAPTVIEVLDWNHWPSAPPLFMADFPGQVRCAPLGLVGRQSTEFALLDQLHCQEHNKQAPRVMVMRNQTTQAVVGLAAWAWHRGAADTCIADIYCHPDYWEEGPKLLAALDLPKAKHYWSYADSSCPQKADCLQANAFRPKSNWIKFPLDLMRQPLCHMPQSAIGGCLAKCLWSLAHGADAPISASWRYVLEKTRASAPIPAKWPHFPLTHRLFADLVLYEKE